MWEMPRDSRIEAGRTRAAVAKRAVAVTAAGGFLAVLVLARQAHPGAAVAHGSQLSTPTRLTSEVTQGTPLGGGSIGSSGGGTPQVQSSTS